MAQRTISVTEFKAKCLALLAEVAESGGTITVTKRGQPLATVGPAKKRRWRSLGGALEGKVKFDDDLLMADTADMWEVVRERERRQRKTA
ncbi:MAG TPA: type II toxin-antitoxin system prevent-host-death family antitoxin [Bryobacteraceae bacterium]|jgi:prevent-host-death family protein|nr:type II toxin-antitoxin system prevent-host-death family antitoxin [Bryobacteraceae bacterium]